MIVCQIPNYALIYNAASISAELLQSVTFQVKLNFEKKITKKIDAGSGSEKKKTGYILTGQLKKWYTFKKPLSS